MRLRRSSSPGLALSALVCPRCAACDAAVAAAVVFCPVCASAAQRVVPAPRVRAANAVDAHAAFIYGGSIARAIVRLKYEQRPDLARPLGDLLWTSIQLYRSTRGDAVVVPVPLHPARLAERGYNQSALLAHCVARRLRAPLDTVALERARDTPRQTSLDRRTRAENVAGAFEVRHGRGIVGRTVLLIDDVRTTGATLEACAQVLRSSGAACVRSFAIAQTDLT